MKRPSLITPLVVLLGSFTLQAAKPDAQQAAREIDAILEKDWKANKLQGNPAISDDVFLRRIYLDVVGRIPTHRETEEFLGSTDKDKRTKLIDRLLASEGYVQHMYNYLADILRAQSQGQAGGITGTAYTNYIKDSLRTDKPWDKFVQEMISAEGDAWDSGAIGYYMRDRGMPLDNLANTVRVFLGTRIECAQCHNHPFDKWSQMQFYQMAAFTYGVETNDYYGPTQLGARDMMNKEIQAERDKFKLAPPAKNMTPEEKKAYKDKMEEMGKQARLASEAKRKEMRPVEEVLGDVRNSLRYTSVSFNAKRELRLPHDYQYTDAKPKSVVSASTMMGHELKAAPGEKSLDAFAKWMTSPENPRFTTVIANRLWKKVFGLGQIEPVDELMEGTVPMNPELMKQLEKLMVSNEYDLKSYLRILLNTRAYQRAVTKEEIPAGVTYHFTGPVLRRMSAEQMWDSFVALINPTPDMPNLPTREAGERRVLAAKKLGDALNELTPEEMLKGAQLAAVKYREQSDQVKDLQKKIADARANDDKQTAKELSRKVSDLQRLARQEVNNQVYLPAVKKLAASVGGAKTSDKPGDPVVASADSSMMMNGGMMAGSDMNADRIKIPGYDKPEKTDEQVKAERQKQLDELMQEAVYYGIPEKERRGYANYRVSQMRNWLRAAEIESPAPRGHYLREFGQSDRETIENANYDASVPQALAMMNSQLLPGIMERYSQLMLTVNKAPYPDDKVEAIYMTLLTRKPTPRELEIWNKAQSSDAGLDISDLIYSLINTQQFIFIQ
jgi:hypothetical protein